LTQVPELVIEIEHHTLAAGLLALILPSA